MKPLLVLIINLSNIINNDGKTNITTIILMIAPLAIKLHNELIISILEYIPTPNVAAKKLKCTNYNDCMDSVSAFVMASFLPNPEYLPFLYFVVIRIA